MVLLKKFKFHRLNTGRNNLDEELANLKRTVEENNKIADELLAEDKETLARIAVLDNAIQQKNQERIQVEKVLLNMRKRLGNVNSLKDEVLKSITAQQFSIDVITNTLNYEKQKFKNLEEAESKWIQEHRVSTYIPLKP